jgi:hypothetical protein
MGLVVQMRVVLVIKTLLRGPMAKLMGEKDALYQEVTGRFGQTFIVCMEIKI